MLILLLVMLFFQAPPSPFDLPLLGFLTAALIGPTKIVVDVIKGALPNLPSGALPLVGLIIAFALAIVFQLATSATLNGPLYALCVLAAIGAQGGAMLATATQNHANDKREEVGK